jgi:hypothetical protein
MHSSIEKQRWLLDEEHVKWIARGMEMITEETKERFQVNKLVYGWDQEAQKDTHGGKK